jgi:hypothetical protein
MASEIASSASSTVVVKPSGGGRCEPLTFQTEKNQIMKSKHESKDNGHEPRIDAATRKPITWGDASPIPQSRRTR